MTNRLLIGLLVVFNIIVGFVLIQDKLDLKFPKFKFAEPNADNVDRTTPKKKPVPVEAAYEPPEFMTGAVTPNKSPPSLTADLSKIESFTYLVSKISTDAVTRTSYKMAIVNEANDKSKLFDAEDVAKMKSTGKMVLADISIGYAEKYRWYWKKAWDSKLPSFLGDKIGNGQYYVQHWWNDEWVKISQGIIDRAIGAGYDGVVLHGVDVYIDLGASVASRDKMIGFIIDLSKYAKKQKPEFLIVPKNAEILGRNPEYIKHVDGILKEDLIFASLANGVTGPKNPIIQITRAMNDLNLFKASEKPVFVIEYVSGSHWTTAKTLLKNNGYIGYSAPFRSPSIIRESTW